MASESDGAPPQDPGETDSPEFTIKLLITWKKPDGEEEDLDSTQEEAIGKFLCSNILHLQEDFKMRDVGRLLRIEEDLSLICSLSSPTQFKDLENNLKNFSEFLLQQYGNSIKAELHIEPDGELEICPENVTKKDSKMLQKFFKNRSAASGDPESLSRPPSTSASPGSAEMSSSISKSGGDAQPIPGDSSSSAQETDSTSCLGEQRDLKLKHESRDSANNEITDKTAKMHSNQDDASELRQDVTESGSSVDSTGGSVQSTLSPQDNRNLDHEKKQDRLHDDTSPVRKETHQRPKLRVFVSPMVAENLKEVTVLVKEKSYHMTPVSTDKSLWETELPLEVLDKQQYQYVCKHDPSFVTRLMSLGIASGPTDKGVPITFEETGNLYDFFPKKSDHVKCRAQFLIWCSKSTILNFEEIVKAVSYCIDTTQREKLPDMMTSFCRCVAKDTSLGGFNIVILILIVLKENLRPVINACKKLETMMKNDFNNILMNPILPNRFLQNNIDKYYNAVEILFKMEYGDQYTLPLLHYLIVSQTPEALHKAVEKYLSATTFPMQFPPTWEDRQVVQCLVDVCSSLVQCSYKTGMREPHALEMLLQKCHLCVVCDVEQNLNDNPHSFGDLKAKVNDELQRRAAEEVRKCVETRHFPDVKKLIKHFEKSRFLNRFLKEFLPDVQHYLEMAQTEGDKESIVKLMKSVVFNVPLQDAMNILDFMCRNSDQIIHTAFMNLLSTGLIHRDKEGKLAGNVCTWMETALAIHLNSKNEGVSPLYKYLDDAVGVLAHAENTDQHLKVINEKLYSEVQNCEVKSVVKEVFAMESQLRNSQTKQMCIQHIQLLLQKTRSTVANITQHVQELFQEISPGKRALKINSRFQADIIAACISHCGTDPGQNDTETFIVTITNFELWCKLFSAIGAHAMDMQRHAGIQSVTKAVQAVTETLQQRTLPCSEARRLIKVKSFVDKAADMAGECKWNISSSLLESYKILCNTDKLFEMGRVVVKILHDIPANIRGKIPHFQDQFQQLENILGKTSDKTVRVADLEAIFLLTSVQEFDSELENLSILSHSDVFQNLTQEVFSGFLKGEEKASSDLGSNVAKTEDRIGAPVMWRKLQETIGRYKELWQPLFDGQDATLGEVDVILNARDVEGEIQMTEKFLNAELCSESCRGLLVACRHNDYKAVWDVLPVVGCDVDALSVDPAVAALKKFVSEKPAQNMRLHEVAKVGQTLQPLHLNELSRYHFDVITQLVKGKGLVEFLQTDISDGDLRDWIEAVEENTEQFVLVSTVCNFINVQSFIQMIVRSYVCAAEASVIIGKLKESIDGCSHLDEKIHDCCTNLNGLKSLFYSMANKDEVTKDVVRATCRDNSVSLLFESANGGCSCKLEYESKGAKKSQTLDALLDHKSRTLLMMNSGSKDVSVTPESQKDLTKEEFDKFVKCVENASDTALALENLWQSGHPDFLGQVEKQVKVDELSTLLAQCSEKLKLWSTNVGTWREEYHELNFFFPHQLWTLWSYLEEGTHRAECISLLKFAGFDVEEAENSEENKVSEIWKKAKEKFSSGSQERTDAFKAVGEVLKSIADVTKFRPKHFPENIPGDTLSLSKVTDTVKEGELFIAALDENSSQILPTLLSLYKNTTNAFPLPHQVLFCQETTLWEEIDLLLMRCQGPSGLVMQREETGAEEFVKQLFCLVHVEKLSSEIQYKLVDAVTKFCSRPFEYFAMICKGTRHHPFLDHFAGVVHNVQPMSHSAMEFCFKELWSDVRVVTSELPGQGKTEFIWNLASQHERELAKLHISGQMREEKILKLLVEMGITSNHSLHIDLGLILDPLQFDIFLFQMIILGCVTYRDQVYLIPTTDIQVEIANTINNTLLNSLHLTLCFPRHHLRWENFSDFVVSDDVISPEQVVCHYLNDKVDVGSCDLHFSGEKTLPPLATAECRAILQRSLTSSSSGMTSDLSFSSVRMFISVLADQLKKLSCSHFMSIDGLKLMIGEEKAHEVRVSFVQALKDRTWDFSMRSVRACRTKQAAAVSGATAVDMANRVDTMLRWSDSNHLIIVFHNQDIQTMSVLYRDVGLVDADVKDLFETQMNKELPDFKKLNQESLQKILQRVARSKSDSLSTEERNVLSESYALTPDNLLKMILIILRIQNNIPVIIMGETGCGKTSLIRYLAKICGIPISVKNIHAGTEEEDLVQFIAKENEKALANVDKPLWIFLDEINTCEHMGLINDIVCHHQCHGETLSPNLALLAACNPYKLRDKAAIRTAGLENKGRNDEQSKLVYRVHPLPETMTDYVWDYGTLSSVKNSDEPAYIERMVGDIFPPDHKDKLISALVMSQNFIRTEEKNDFCVSLRDVNRFKVLYHWFQETPPSSNPPVYDDDDKRRRATILALAHVYHSRLSSSLKRREYRTELAEVFQSVWKDITEGFIFTEIIYKEQKGILDIMEMPPGIARNSALQENIFVVLTCILNRMPIFLVGKPGCSKSLSLQLIKSSLRGKDSTHEYFKRLPQLHFVRYQGSESSTSEGILKVFEKARKYKDSNRQQQEKHGNSEHRNSGQQEDVLPVVILDEIGLAEVSRFNPLKVLHSLLEPGEQELPDVAVVGVSNWALDAAKMNRAIHLSRPDMDRRDLFLTGVSIDKAILDEEKDEPGAFKHPLEEGLLEAVANAYDEYRNQQLIENFHGLRDYYSLVKCIARQNVGDCPTIDMVLKGILRNFGGIPSEIGTLFSTFQHHLKQKGINDSEATLPQGTFHILQLVEENLNDTSARHLMLITHGDVALSILKDHLLKGEKDFEIILGSKFEEDSKSEYSCKIISDIIHYMELDVVLILKDLDGIYGSLYDMLNQNYIRIGSKSTCRIALGAYNNQICQVHKNFRCIVLMEEQKLDYSDPPFLNRFEKQRLTLEDDQSSDEKAVCSEIVTWLKELGTFHELVFGVNDLIPFYGPSLVPSVVHHLTDKFPMNESFGQKCMHELLKVMTPEGILRAIRATGMDECSQRIVDIRENYLQLPIHEGLQNYLSSLMKECESGLQSIVLTHSSPHVDVSSCITSSHTEEIQMERLGNIKSEKMLSERTQKFWSDPSKKWMIWQCSAATDMVNFLLLKTTLEKHKREYMKARTTAAEGEKHMILLVHIDRSKSYPSLSVINYLMGWNLVFLDVLDVPNIPLGKFLDNSITDLVKEREDVRSFVKREILWAFSRMSYTYKERDPKCYEDIINAIRDSSQILQFLEESILKWIQEHDFTKKKDWQVDVACNKTVLQECSTFRNALEQEVDKSLQHPLAAVIFRIEESNAWEAVTTLTTNPGKESLWIEFVRNTSIVDISHLKAPMGPGCYSCHTILQDLRHPFSRVLFNRLENLKEMFMTARHAMLTERDLEEEEGPLPPEILENLCRIFYSQILQAGDDMIRKSFGKLESADYRHGFFEITLSSYPLSVRELHRGVLSRYIEDFQSQSFSETVVQLHCSFWFHESHIAPELDLVKICCLLPDISWGELLAEKNENFPAQSTHQEDTDNEFNADEPSDPIQMQTPEIASATEKHVDMICHNLIPNASLFEGGSTTVSMWHRTVSTVLCLAERVTPRTRFAKCLSVAVDLVSYLSQHSPEDSPELQKLLVSLGEELRREHTVDSERVFHYFVELLKNPVLQHTADMSLHLQLLFSTYITSCLLEDLESESSHGFTMLMESLVTGCSGTQRQMFLSPSLHVAFLKAVNSSQVLEMVRRDEDSLTPNENVLFQIDRCIKGHEQKRDFRAGSVLTKSCSHMLCMCSDVLQHFVLETERDIFVVNDEERFLHDSLVFDVIQKCISCVKHFKFTLKSVMAVAVLKRYITLVCKALSSSSSSEEIQSVLPKLDAVIRIYHESKKRSLLNPLQRFFLRIMLNGGGTKTFRNALSMFREQLPFLENVCEGKSWTSLDLTPMSCRLSDSLETSRAAAILKPVGDDTQDAALLFEKSKLDCKKAFMDLTYACEKFYLPKSYRNLSSDERESMNRLVEKFQQHMPGNIIKVFHFLQGDHYIGNFAVADNMKEEDFQLLSVILHMVVHITASNPNDGPCPPEASLFLTCLEAPLNLRYWHVPGSVGTGRELQPFGFLFWNLSAQSTSLILCTCGTYNAFIGDISSEQTCSSCSKTLDLSRAKSVHPKCVLAHVSSKDHDTLDGEDTLGYEHSDLKSLEKPAIAVRKMTPCSFRVLQLMIHGCFLGSLALGNCSEIDLRDFLHVPSDTGLIDYLDGHVRTHWRVLQSLTQMGNAQLARFLHIIMEDLLMMPSKSDSAEARELFENDFSEKVDAQIARRFFLLKDDADKSSQRLRKQGFEVVFEEEVEEVDREPFMQNSDENKEVGYFEAELSRLFRETCKPTVEQMKSEFILQPSVENVFPLVGLVLSKENHLALLQHLHPILAWHLHSVKTVSYCFQRDECKRMGIQEYIHAFDDSLTNSIDQKFTAFLKAWNAVCKRKNVLALSSNVLEQTKEIEYDSRLTDCIAMDFRSVILHVLRALMEIHNEFLCDALVLSLTTKTPALAFFRRSDHQSCVSVQPLEFLSQGQVLQLQLAEGNMNFSQICTQYGHGREIQFDFYHYEMLWGKELLMGKVLLEMRNKFPLIAFSGDLIRGSATLLQDVNETIPQVDVSEELKSAIKDMKKQNAANLRKLQDSLEVMLSLLKRTGGDAVTTVVSYLENWASLLSTPPDAVKGFLKKEQVKLNQVIGLLQYVEEIQASMVTKALAEKYRKEVPAKAFEELDMTANKIDDARDKIKLMELLLRALQKFAFRYLSSVSSDIKGKLIDFASDPSLWPLACLNNRNFTPAMDFLPSQLYVEHIYFTIIHLEEEIKRMNEVLSKTWLPGQKKGKSQAELQEKKRKKQLKTFK